MGGGPRPVWWALKTRRKGHLRVWVPGVARLGPSGVAFYAQRARLPPVSSTARSTFPLPGGICDFAGPSQPARGDLSCGSTGKASASPHQARIKTTRTRHIACGSRTKVEYLDPVVPGPPGRSGVYRYVIILAAPANGSYHRFRLRGFLEPGTPEGTPPVSVELATTVLGL